MKVLSGKPSARAFPRRRSFAGVILPLLLLTSCGETPSTADVQRAAKERVREALKLTPESVLFANVFVGEPAKGDMVLCGTVSGRTAEGRKIEARRFIAAIEPARWLAFEPADGLDTPSRPDKFLEWHTSCLGEEEVR